MKTLCFLAVLIFSFIGNAQLKESYFQYHIELKALDTTLKTRQAIQVLRGSQMELYFAHNKSRMDFKMGNLKMTSVIVDKDKDITLFISQDKNGKTAQVRKADVNKGNAQDPYAKIQYTGNTKVIMGYHCKELILTSLGTKATYWCTDEIKLEQGQDIINSNLPSFPVMFSKEQEGVRMTFQLSNMKDHFDYPLETIFFTIPPKGFKIIN